MPEPEMAAGRLGEFRWARWLFVIVGFLCVVAGVIVLDDPQNSLATIAVVTGIFLLVDGIVDVLVSLLSGADGRALGLLIGVFGIVVGIVLIRHPITSVVPIAMFVGIALILRGLAVTMAGWLMYEIARDSQLRAHGRVAAT